MPLRTYNGFGHNQRMKAGAWQKEQYARGRLKRPSRCCACGQTHGPLIDHCEDYSEPFRPETTCRYPMCYRCHMMVHCRHRDRVAWARYRDAIESGVRYPAINSFPALLSQHMGRGAKWPEPELVGPPPAWKVLTEIQNYAYQDGARLGTDA